MKRHSTKNDKRIRKKRRRKAIQHKRRAVLAPYIDELERSRVPQSGIQAAVTMMHLLLGWGAK